jgi:hypothetical protein
VLFPVDSMASYRMTILIQHSGLQDVKWRDEELQYTNNNQ